MEDFILELENITKEFPGVLALDNVSLRLKKKRSCWSSRGKRSR